MTQSSARNWRDSATVSLKEVDFREYLKTLASAKLLPILKDLFDRDEYRDKIENERYDFLRTKEVFKKCMDSAYDKFGWTKRSL